MLAQLNEASELTGRLLCPWMEGILALQKSLPASSVRCHQGTRTAYVLHGQSQCIAMVMLVELIPSELIVRQCFCPKTDSNRHLEHPATVVLGVMFSNCPDIQGA